MLQMVCFALFFFLVLSFASFSSFVACIHFCGWHTHLCGMNQGETYVRPTVIKQERKTVLSRLRGDVQNGSVLGLMFDETTDCTTL